MAHRGLAAPLPPRSARQPASYAVAVLAVLLIASLLGLHLAARARGADASRCERFEAASSVRASEVTGSGRRVVVIGDSYAAGLGLTAPAGSWPSRLTGRIHVAAFSGSGFSRSASPCEHVSFADRAPAALGGGAALVVVEGGLNDVDQSSAAITAGFERLMVSLAGYRVVILGPPAAPVRAGAVPRVDALLAALAREHDVAYVRTSGLDLSYLGDGLHLTRSGHAALGVAVARELALLDPS